MDWLRRFMVGRYGGDQLSIFLLVLSIVLTLISRIAGVSILMTISYIPLFVAVYRMLSKDLQKRSMENYRFAIFVSPIYAKFKNIQSHIKGLKTHKYYKCTTCKTMLRVPKGKGKIVITCPQCKDRFTRKT
ncbi:MAG: hypothetical protein JJT76_06650 [Clostridiaceae bacterium]|nr:hypothetical protein [Clostridiaceae bacterium]